MKARRFHTVFKSSSGAQFFGQIGTIPAENENFQFPVRLLQTGIGAKVKPGESFQTATGERYLIATHLDGYNGEPEYRTFKLFRVDSKLPWSSRMEGEDSTFGLNRETDADVDHGDIWCAVRPASVTDTLNFSDTKAVLITGAAIKPNDQIGPYKVRWVEEVLGVRLAEVR